MATLKLTLDQRRKRADNKYPLVIRLSHRSKTRDLSLGIKLSPHEYDSKRSKIKDNRLNKEVQYQLLRYREILSNMLISSLEIDVQSLKDLLLNQDKKPITIYEFWVTEIDRLISVGRVNGSRSYKMVLSAIGNDINLNKSFSSLSYLDIIQLETKLYQRGMSVNGIGVYMRTFRAVCNKAIYQDLVGIEHYPFRKYKIRKEKTVPRVLDIDEVRRYFHLNLDHNNSLYLSWLIGKLLFMLRGINFTDLLLLSSKNIHNKYLIYHRMKTGKVYSVKFNDEVLGYLNELWSFNIK